jgi:hypothetical protein
VIAVVAPEHDRDSVREFFELFKTPWEFYQSGRKYDVALVAVGAAEHLACDAKVLITYGSDDTAFDARASSPPFIRQQHLWLRCPQGRIPIYGRCLTFDIEGFGLVDELHGRSVGYISSRGRTVCIRLGYDLFREIDLLLSCGQPVENSGVPTADRHVALLRALILGCKVPLVEIPPIPHEYNFIVCLTHDVDHPAVRLHKWDRTLFGFGYRAVIGSVFKLIRRRLTFPQLVKNWSAIFKLPFVYLGLSPDFWNTCQQYLRLEHGLRATYYFIPRKNAPGRVPHGRVPAERKAAYDLRDVADQIHCLRSAGCEIGLHGIDAWLDPASATEERRLISAAAGLPVAGVRMHWLYFTSYSRTAIEAAGFSYDSTVGYNETVGFRSGTTQVFKPIGATTLLELPLHIMDTALFFPSQMGLSFMAAKSVVLKLIDEAGRIGGALTINWHDRSIAPERLWDGFYIWLLEELKHRTAWFSTAADAVTWFRKRRCVTFEQISWDDQSLRAVVRATESPDGSPNLVLRVHKPNRQLDAQWTLASVTAGHCDVGFRDAAEIQLSLS